VLERFAPYLLNRLVAAMNRRLARALQAQGLSQRLWRVLAVLAAGDRRSLRALEAETIVPQSTLSRLIDRMAADGLVAKAGDRGDGRSVRIALTPAGRAAYLRMLPVALAERDRVLAGLSPGEVETLMDLLGRMRANLRGEA
jgi:DNA-binding MarR family transcriptional regulator